jgi:hypothetical protein
MSNQAVIERNKLRRVKNRTDIDHNLSILIRGITPVETLPAIEDWTRLRRDLDLKGEALQNFFVSVEQVFNCTLSVGTRKCLETVGNLKQELGRQLACSQRTPPR